MTATPKFRGTLDDWDQLTRHIHAHDRFAATTAELDALWEWCHPASHTQRNRTTPSFIFGIPIVEVPDWDAA